MDRDAEVGLPGATVHLAGTIVGAKTDINGYFVVAGLPPRTYTLEVLYLGYETEVIESVDVVAGKEIDVHVSLLSSIYTRFHCYDPIVYEPPLVSRDPYASRIVSYHDWHLDQEPRWSGKNYEYCFWPSR